MRLGYLALIILVGCASGNSDVTTPQDVTVESWDTLEVTPINQLIEEAVASDAEWPTSPLRITVELFGGDNDTRVLSLMEEKNRGEGDDTTIVVMIRDGFLDDSVRGDWHRIIYERHIDSTWRVAEVRRAFRCWRGHHLDAFSSQLCP